MTIEQKAKMDKIILKFNDGILELDKNDCFCAIGKTAHDYMFKIKSWDRKGKNVRKIMEGLENLTVVL